MLGAEPVVPGFTRIAAHEEQSVPAGEVLLGELNCRACHQADEAIAKRIPSKAAPDLSEVGGRVTPQYLRKFLFDTHAAKPGTPMPNLFHGVAPQQREEEVEELAHYLSSLGGPVERSKRGGNERLVERGRELYHSVGCVACHAPESGADKLKSPVVPLGDLASKTTVDKLSEFLLDPLKIPQVRSHALSLAWGERSPCHRGLPAAGAIEGARSGSSCCEEGIRSRVAVFRGSDG